MLTKWANSPFDDDFAKRVKNHMGAIRRDKMPSLQAFQFLVKFNFQSIDNDDMDIDVKATVSDTFSPQTRFALHSVRF